MPSFPGANRLPPHPDPLPPGERETAGTLPGKGRGKLRETLSSKDGRDAAVRCRLNPGLFQQGERKRCCQVPLTLALSREEERGPYLARGEGIVLICSVASGIYQWSLFAGKTRRPL